MKRLFIGSYISTAELVKAYPAIRADFDTVSSGKWVEQENLHFTWKFLGDVDIHSIHKIQCSLNQYLQYFNQELALGSLGAFSSLLRPNVLYVNLKFINDAHLQIYSKMDNILSGLGFQSDGRTFSPHLTLCRIKSSTAEIKNKILSYKESNFGKMSGFEINLIESQLTRNGPIYKLI
ncbi:MAG: RNA 2',3'-cyclic phosphodiesterase [Candidatus Kapabacteria bacterium]|nr:RNA 2',3'-cyclic phosphodiesterase [Candidatus Kapabacteria bacterium]